MRNCPEGVGHSPPQWHVVRHEEMDGTDAGDCAQSGHRKRERLGCQCQQAEGRDSLSSVIYHLHLGEEQKQAIRTRQAGETGRASVSQLTLLH